MKLSISKRSTEIPADDHALQQRRFGAALLHGDAEGAARVVDELLAGQHSLAEIYLAVMAPALVNVGDAWCSAQIGVGEEKLATQIVIQQMERLRSMFVVPEPQSPYRVLVCCVQGEQHFVGARMVADLCLLKGWGVDFLGPDVPSDALINTIKRRRSHLVALSVTMEPGIGHVHRLLDKMATLAPAPKVVVSGQFIAVNPSHLNRHPGFHIAHEAVEGVELIGKLLRTDRPKAALKEYLLTLARRVRDLRTRKGWTQEELAAATRVTRGCIVAVEGGKQNVSMDILVRLGNALGEPAETLLTGENVFVRIPRGQA
ncbi:MAG: cobalamin-dependent protein [Methylocella sp.]